MNPEEFRKIGHQLIDWIADYRSNVENLPVRSRVQPGEIRAQLPSAPPAQPQSFDQIFAVRRALGDRWLLVGVLPPS